jgi:hypothetical protein
MLSACQGSACCDARQRHFKARAERGVASQDALDSSALVLAGIPRDGFAGAVLILWELQVTALLTWMEAWPSCSAVGTTPKADKMRMIQRIINSAMVLKMKAEMNQAVAAAIRMAAIHRALIAVATARSACMIVQEMLPTINGNRETKDESNIKSMTANGAQEGSKADMTEYMMIEYRALSIVSKIQNMVTPTTFPADSNADT